MAFVCVLDTSGFECDVFNRGDHGDTARAVVFRIGVDDHKNMNYFAQVGLEIMAGGGLEYYFNILESCGDDRSERVYWSGKETSKFIEAGDRERILSAVCRATEWLLNYACPSEVYRCTYDDDLPEKSLEKHRLIGQAFERAGYWVARGDPYGGKRFWWAYRFACGSAATTPTLDGNEDWRYCKPLNGRVRL